jgi:leader peptidase (prepilin peptidase)/N-methyltransferase
MSLPLIQVYAAIVGAAIGSFLNVCVYRWPNGLSVISPRSRCPNCEQSIAWYDNIPILGYLILRGRCRGCRERISIQYPLVELATALIWLAAVALFGVSFEALRAASFLTLLLGIALTDAKHMVIPDHFSLGGMVIGLILAAVLTDFARFSEFADLGHSDMIMAGGMLLWLGTVLDAFPILKFLTGAVVGYLLMLGVAYAGEKAFRKPALGLGDVHMMAMVGAFVGISGMLLTVLLGSVLGLLIGVPISWIRGKLVRLGTYLPLGTFLAMGAAITYIWGETIIGWYMNFALGGP